MQISKLYLNWFSRYLQKRPLNGRPCIYLSKYIEKFIAITTVRALFVKILSAGFKSGLNQNNAI